MGWILFGFVLGGISVLISGELVDRKWVPPLGARNFNVLVAAAIILLGVLTLANALAP
jgi:hypothetical protein